MKSVYLSKSLCNLSVLKKRVLKVSIIWLVDIRRPLHWWKLYYCLRELNRNFRKTTYSWHVLGRKLFDFLAIKNKRCNIFLSFFSFSLYKLWLTSYIKEFWKIMYPRAMKTKSYHNEYKCLISMYEDISFLVSRIHNKLG